MSVSSYSTSDDDDDDDDRYRNDRYLLHRMSYSDVTMTMSLVDRFDHSMVYDDDDDDDDEICLSGGDGYDLLLMMYSVMVRLLSLFERLELMGCRLWLWLFFYVYDVCLILV